MGDGRTGAHDHVLVSVEPGSDVQEELAVIVLPEDAYELVVPPALTVGLAVGDVFAVDAMTAQPNVLRRGGNLTTWLHPCGGAAERIRSLSDQVAALGGTFEGERMKTGSSSSPCQSLRRSRRLKRSSIDSWSSTRRASYFGNVYAADGVTPLGWWDGP